MAKTATHFVDFYAALAVDNDAGDCVNGVELRGKSIPQGTRFYRFRGAENINSALSLLIKYNANNAKMARLKGNKILLGIIPEDFEEFSFDTDTDSAAARTAFRLIRDFARYKFGVDAIRADSHSSL